MKSRKKYDPRLNCRGLARDPNRDPEPTTDRGRRRRLRAKVRHQHTFKVVAPRYGDPTREANETTNICTSCGEKRKRL